MLKYLLWPGATARDGRRLPGPGCGCLSDGLLLDLKLLLLGLGSRAGTAGAGGGTRLGASLGLGTGLGDHKGLLLNFLLKRNDKYKYGIFYVFYDY